MTLGAIIDHACRLLRGVLSEARTADVILDSSCMRQHYLKDYASLAGVIERNTVNFSISLSMIFWAHKTQ